MQSKFTGYLWSNLLKQEYTIHTGYSQLFFVDPFRFYVVSSGEATLQMIYMGCHVMYLQGTVICNLRMLGLRNGETVIKHLVELPRITFRFAWS